MKKAHKILMAAAALAFVPLAASLFAGCRSAPKTDPLAFTMNALAATDGGKTILSGPAEAGAVARFEKFSGDLSVENITNHLRDVYAENIYFRDPFKEIHGAPDFQTYLLKDVEAVSEYKLDWQDIGHSQGDYYFRWVMTVKLKREGNNKKPSQTCGISEVRFGADGKVIYEQDYFDAGAFLYERIPILGGEIRFIKNRL